MLNKNALKTLLMVVPLVTLAACKSGPTDAELEAEANSQAEAAAQQVADAQAVADAEAKRVDVAKADALQKAKDMFESEKATLVAQNVVYFDFDQASVKSDFHSVLDMHAAFLVKNPGQSIVVEGHCDNRGTPEYNIALGERRAQSVETYLMNAGVSSAQVSVVSYGEEKPAVQGGSEYAFAQNRRGIVVYQ
ncbi:MAG: peptidoglycan-associated lipoprotein [Bermanella sp.]|jgi:peptidoglycan-associated lipoprotein|uniref:peptidoglycan-associated lipoprotein Pal n=1 Tax=Glaciecola sp. 33A TaxID=2057807 RepID=UPI000C332EAA|nr:peptidoglycan-associated lipoprotein Pal [Glaciecola sp. 33A]PKI01906.1 peptidoglycan-associated lipoprotein [Glaciecola sp. 33A]